MLSEYLLSILVLISSQAIVDGASSAHVSSLTIPNHHHVITPLQNPRLFRKPFSSGSKKNDKDLSSMLPIRNEKGQSAHTTGPDQHFSDLILPSDDYLKKAFERNSQLTLRQTVRENIREIDGSCLKLLAKRTTGNGGRNCVKMESFVLDLQEYIADMRSNSLTTRNLFLESQALFYHQLVDTSGVTDNMAVSLIYHLNEMVANVKSFNVDPQFLDGAEVTKVIGKKGRSITHWNTKGNWETLVDYKDGKHSFINEELNQNQQGENLLRFLDLNFPQGPYGKPNGNVHHKKELDVMLAHTESYIRELRQRSGPIAVYNLQQEYNELFDFLHPTIIFRNTYEVDPTMQISVKFFDDGSTAAVFRIFPTSSKAATYTSEFNAKSLMNLLETPPLIKGGERTDKDGIVRDLRVGKYDSSIDEYYLSSIHLMTNEEREIKYKVRDFKGFSFDTKDYSHGFLNKNYFFQLDFKFPDLPPAAPINKHGNSQNNYNTYYVTPEGDLKDYYDFVNWKHFNPYFDQYGTFYVTPEGDLKDHLDFSDNGNRETLPRHLNRYYNTFYATPEGDLKNYHAIAENFRN